MISRLTAAGVAFIGLAVLFFSFSRTELRLQVPQLYRMAIPSAFCFVVAGGVLAVFGLPRTPRWKRRIIRGCGTLLALVGALTLITYVVGWESRLGQLMGVDFLLNQSHARMGATTALNFLLVGLALACFCQGRGAAAGQLLVATTAFIAWLTLIGYAYDVQAFYEMGSRSVRAVMAVHTAAAFLLLAFAYLAAQPRHGITAIVLSRTVSGGLTRRLLPLAFFAPGIIGWLQLVAEELGWFGERMGIALFALTLTVIMTAVIVVSARQLHLAEETRLRAEVELRESRGTLELLDHLAQATRGMSDPRDIMATVARCVGSHLNVSRCAYADVAPDSEQFTIRHDYTDGCASTVGQYHLSSFGPRAVNDLRAGRTLILHDVDRELLPEEGAEMFNALQIKAIITCPLIKEGKLRAMMAVHQSSPRHWTRAEVSLLESVVERSWSYIERAHAEASLRDSERQLRLIADAMPALVAYVDRDLQYRFANAEYRAWFGEEGRNMAGKSIHETLGHDAVTEFRPHLERALAGEEVRFEFEAPFRHGGTRWVDAQYIPHRDESGRVQGLFVLVLDISERKKTEAQLARAKESLERQVQERTASLRDTIAQLEMFSYSISHDMRGPLRAMVSFAQLLRTEHATQLDAPGHEYLQRIVNSARRLDRLIQDVLQYSRVARETLPMEPINLDRVLNDILHQYPDIAQHQSQVRIGSDCANAIVLANPAALSQVLSNLLANALKFVPHHRAPEVEVNCEARGDFLRVTVRDNGVGVPPGQREKIFGVFQRLHGAEFPGTGIGLSIVKKAVERMGGRVGVESQVGSGSEFWIELGRASESVVLTPVE